MKNLELVTLPSDVLSEYLENSLKSYAKDRAITDYETLEEAEQNARGSVDKILFEGGKTPGHYFFSICDRDLDEEIGRVWLYVDDKKKLAWLYDILIFAEKRHQGYGTRSMKCIQAKAKELGARVLWLNVMGHNREAQGLYQKIGMRTAAVHMNLLLDS